MEKLGWVTFSESEHVHFIHAFYQIGGKKKMTNQTFFFSSKIRHFCDNIDRTKAHHQTDCISFPKIF